MKDLRIGFALGSGAARGWAHIGVIQALADNDVQPDIVCGTSAGALVGGAYVAGHMEALEQWLRTLSRFDVARFFDLSLTSGGLLAGKRIIKFFRERFGDIEIQSLPIPFAAVATELETGHEIWFQSGSLLDAVRASISVPGIFEPVCLNGTWYVDGGIVNPVPVALCRALGADIVVAVDVNSGVHRRSIAISNSNDPDNLKPERSPTSEFEIFPVRLTREIKDRVSDAITGLWRGSESKPGLFYVLSNSAHFMQERITRSRMACDPPDIVLCPKTIDIGIMDFHCAAQAIAAGKDCVGKYKTEVLELVK